MSRPPAEIASHHEVDASGQFAHAPPGRPCHRRVPPRSGGRRFRASTPRRCAPCGVTLLVSRGVAVVRNGHEGYRWPPKLTLTRTRVNVHIRQCADPSGLGLLLLTACRGRHQGTGDDPRLRPVSSTPSPRLSRSPAVGHGRATPAPDGGAWRRYIAARLASRAARQARRRGACDGGHIASARERRRRRDSAPTGGTRSTPAVGRFALAVGATRSPATSAGAGSWFVRMPTTRAHPRRSEAAPSGATRSMYVDRRGTHAIVPDRPPLRRVSGSVAGLFESAPRFGPPAVERIGRARQYAWRHEGHTLDGVRQPVRLPRGGADSLGFPPRAPVPPVNGSAPGRHVGSSNQTFAARCISSPTASPRVFYQASIAELIVQEMARGGGLITRDDLARYRAKLARPDRDRLRGYTVYTNAPPSGAESRWRRSST